MMGPKHLATAGFGKRPEQAATHLCSVGLVISFHVTDFGRPICLFD